MQTSEPQIDATDDEQKTREAPNVTVAVQEADRQGRRHRRRGIQQPTKTEEVKGPAQQAEVVEQAIKSDLSLDDLMDSAPIEREKLLDRCCSTDIR